MIVYNECRIFIVLFSGILDTKRMRCVFINLFSLLNFTAFSLQMTNTLGIEDSGLECSKNSEKRVDNHYIT